ncbi:MAG: ATP-binding protein [Aureliella sp.]
MPTFNSPTDSTLTVLVIEDDADTRANLCDLLELDGYKVIVAACAEEARNCLASASPDIAILDRKLPDGMAETLLPDLLKRTPHTAFIVVTGYADMESAIQAMRAGASDYLLKPIQPDDFRQRIQRIISHRSLELEYQKQNTFAEQILQTAEAIVLVLDLDGTIQQFNPFLTTLTGWRMDEVRGQDWFNMFIPEFDRDRVRQVFIETAEGIKSSGIVNPIVAKDGSRKEIRWSNSALMHEDGSTYAVLAVGLDITDFSESQRRVLQAERLATIGQMMAALAHESRNALQRIQASVDLLELEVEEVPDAADDLRKIRRAAGDLHILLEEVRAFAAPIQLRKQRSPLGPTIRQAWADLEQQHATRDAHFQLDPHLDATEVDFDPVRIQQVFRNFFENSLHAAADPVHISVSLAASASDAETLTLSISDNGPGLSAEQKEKIFEAFFTTKDQGTGLGMAIVERIMDAHQGSIECDAEYSGGARFLLTFPTQPPLS